MSKLIEQAELLSSSSASLRLISAYSAEYFIVGNEKFESNIIIKSDFCDKFGEIDTNLLDKYLVKKPDLIIFGSNQRDYIISLMSDLGWANKIMYEVMPKAPAIRTYNALQLEGRNLLAILELD